MLFAYPTVATAENWLHQCLTDLLLADFDDIDANRPRAAWPGCIVQDRRAALGPYSGLRDMRVALLAGYEALTPADRLIVRRAVDDQSALTDLFDGGRPADPLNDLPEAARAPAKQFFEKAFKMLTTLGIRDVNYRVFLRNLDHRVCGFCGCEYFSGPSSRREPLDHYLAVSLYPFAGTNARNLVPMGPKCNSSYKLAQDILRDGTGTRRLCFDPYAATPVRITLMATKLFTGEDGLPEWNVTFEGDADRIATWNHVFDMRRRFIEDHLDSIYKNAIRVFGTLRRKQPAIFEGLGITGAFRHLGELSRAKGWDDRAFLEAALYDLLEARSAAGGGDAARIQAAFSDAVFATA